MGLLDKLFGAGKAAITNGVSGVAHVVSCSANRGRGVYQACHMQLVIEADGVPPTAVEFDGLVHRNRWPQPGLTLPVTVDRTDPNDFRIEWDEVENTRDRARSTAEGIAAALRGEGGVQGISLMDSIGGAQVINLSGQDLSQLSEEKKAKLRALGIDPDGLAATARSAPSSSTNDRLDQLERLAKLHQSGALTDEEFAAQKRALLDER